MPQWMVGAHEVGGCVSAVVDLFFRLETHGKIQV